MGPAERNRRAEVGLQPILLRRTPPTLSDSESDWDSLTSRPLVKLRHPVAVGFNEIVAETDGLVDGQLGGGVRIH